MSPSQLLKAARQALKAENAKYDQTWQEVPRKKWPEHLRDKESAPLRFYRNKYFGCQIWEEPNGFIRLSICRTELDSKGRWRDGITWEELMEIKRQVGFGDKDAMEVYPADRDIVNVSNMRHLWVTAEPIAVAWRSQEEERI